MPELTAQAFFDSAQESEKQQILTACCFSDYAFFPLRTSEQTCSAKYR